MTTLALARRFPVLALPLALALPACGSDGSSAVEGTPPAQDAGLDATQPDSGSDAVDEPSLDSAPDTVVDAQEEPAVDAAADHVADVEDPWPTCDTQPAGVPTKTVAQLWQDNAAAPAAAWVPDVIVTAISWGGCSAGHPCQVFLQTEATYPTLAAGAHQAIKLFVSDDTAQHFTQLQVGQRVNVYAHAWRYNFNPAQNELLLQVNATLRGCAWRVGDATATPIPNVQLSELTVDAYENTVGPLLVQVQDVTGKPGPANETFGLWKTGGPFVDAGPESIVSASPYSLSGGSFTGLPTGGQTEVDFDAVTGVFGLFVPSTDGGASAKYLELYPRGMADMPQL